MSYNNTIFNVCKIIPTIKKTILEQDELYKSILTNINPYSYGIRQNTANNFFQNFITLCKSGFLFDSYSDFEYFIKAIQSYVRTPQFHSISMKNIKELLNIGFSFDPETSFRLISIDDNLCDIIMKNYNYTIDINFLKNINIAENILRNNTIFEKICKIDKVNICLTAQNINEYLYHQNSSDFIIKKILSDPINNINYNEYILHVAQYNSLEIFKLIIFRGSTLNTDVFERVCLTYINRLEKIMLLLDNKIEPTKKCFNNILDNNKYFSFQITSVKINNYQDRPEDIINLFISKGYIINYEDVINCIKKRIIIKEQYIKNCDIKFTSDFYAICLEAGYEIPPYKINVKANVELLNKACLMKKSITQIKNIVASHNIIPDKNTLVNAIDTHRGRTQTVKFLIDNNATVDTECLHKWIEATQIPQLKMVYEQFLKNNKIEFICEKKEQINIVSSNKQESEEIKEDKIDVIKDIVSQIPSDFDYNTNILSKIPKNIINEIKVLKKIKSINFNTLRNLILNHHNNNEKITNTCIILEKPFLFNKKTQITTIEINEWIYSLLDFNEYID